MSKSPQITVRLTPEAHEVLDRLAERSDKYRGQILSEAVIAYSRARPNEAAWVPSARCPAFGNSYHRGDLACICGAKRIRPDLGWMEQEATG